MGLKFYPYSLVAVLLALSATSCANFSSINRTKHTYGKGQVHFTDAKQRAIIMQRFAEYPDDKSHPYWIYRYCSEPAPDVFSVLATSVAAELSGTKTAEQKQLAANMAIAMAESGATIERTQTINLLRLSMYSTCERYLNGALTQSEFVIQAARDQRAMVAILAIEQLTGTVRPPSTILNANVSGFSSSKPEEVIAAIKAAMESVEKAETDSLKLTEELKTLEALPACPDEPLSGDDEAGEQDETEEPSCAKPDDVSGKKSELEKANSKLAGAKAYYDTVLSVVKNGGAGLGASASANGKAGDGVDTTEANRAAIADTVLRIVDSTFSDQSELTFVCMVRLREDAPAAGMTDELYSKCAALIGAQIQVEVDKLRQPSAYLTAQEVVRDFDSVWIQVASGNSVDKAKVKTAIVQANQDCGNCIIQARIDQLEKAKDRESLRTAFNQLTEKARVAFTESVN